MLENLISNGDSWSWWGGEVAEVVAKRMHKQAWTLRKNRMTSEGCFTARRGIRDLLHVGRCQAVGRDRVKATI